MIIVFFPLLYLLGKYFLGRGTAAEENPEEDVEEPKADAMAQASCAGLKRRFSGDSNADEEVKSTVKFNPPAYIQRYQAVQKILSDPCYAGKLKKVVDFGCSELGFCMYIKNIIGIEEALFVDIDRFNLDIYKDKTRPLHIDFLHRRSTPLVLRVLEGSVTQPDKSLENCDAVVCIELIEHLYPEDLTNLPYNIFGFIKPKVVIITTPNSDFNVLFNNMSGFRHWDHKFEWSRSQFEDWSNNIVSRFPEYEVKFQGIGDGPLGTEHLGACSQMAIFNKKYDLLAPKVPGVEGLFKTVVEYEYPYEIDNRSDEQKILDDAEYYIRKFSINNYEFEEEIPLEKLMSVMQNIISINDLKEVLENNNWAIADRENGPVVLVPPLSGFSDPVSEQSLIDDDFLDDIDDDNDDIYGRDPGPPSDYFVTRDNELNNMDSIPNDNYEENWDDYEPHIDVPISEGENNYTENISLVNEELHNSTTSSIYPDEVCLDDIVTESRSSELINSADNESILISSFSETRGSENSEIPRNSCSQAQTSLTNIDISILESNAPITLSQSEEETDSESFIKEAKNTFDKEENILESNTALNVENLTDLCLVTPSPLSSKSNKKLKLNINPVTCNINDNTFDEPKYTSSPHGLSDISRKRKINNVQTEFLSLDSNSSNNENTSLCTKKISINNDCTVTDSYSCYNKCATSENKFSECLTEKSVSANSENNEHYTGTIPKNSKKILNVDVNAQTETRLERISPDTPESLPNSISPEVMDSGYPNSSSPPDLSPEHDLSSIDQDRTSDSESPSIADVPRIGFFDVEVRDLANRDLANNNLDGEGNNLEAEDNRDVNDLRPLINVLEHDLQNENDIYIEEE